MSERRVCIVVPCYNEAARLDAAAFTEAISGAANLSFVLVNDGSTDETSPWLHALAARHPDRIEVIDQHENTGKAGAVRHGMLHAFSTGAVRDFIEVLETSDSVDIVLGARVAMLGHEIERRAVRHYAGRVFATLASATLGLHVYDTQCGAKLFRANDRSRSLFEEPFGSRWVFDVELLARYLERGGLASGIREIPLKRWNDIPGSKVKPIDFFRSVVELGRIRRRYGRRKRG